MLLYEEILVGSKKYHDEEKNRYDSYYDRFFKFKNCSIQKKTEPPETHEAENLVGFVNSWKGRCPTKPHELERAIRSIWPNIIALKNENLLTCNFIEARDSVERIFNAIAGCGSRHEVTNTSKIIHLLHPELFVMWDKDIRDGYAVGHNGMTYAYYFLPRMQHIAHQALEQITKNEGLPLESAIERLCVCGHKLTKVLDEYNFAKFKLQ